MVQFYVDDPANVFFVRTASDVPAGLSWDFNHPFFLLLNLAVGGTGSWPGPPDNTTPNPASMVVDYVRWYTPSPIPGPSLTAAPISVKAGEPGTSTVNLSSVAGSGRVYLSCATSAPKATCSVNSSDALNPYTVDFSQTATGTAVITVTTQANTAALSGLPAPGSGRWPILFLAGAIASLALISLPLSRNRRPRRCLACLGVVFAVALLASCGGGNTGGTGGTPPNGTPPGTYSVTVNAYTVSNSSGSPDSAATIALTVN